ncbi:MAG: hypothetical protein M0Q41_13170, partial [Bacteroidales bacterium]|nr:hypothetical protein [Bacteroidales bacterium]
MAKAHNPKLNVYILTLNNQSDSVETFRDLFKAKYGLNNEDDSIVFKKYFEEFLKAMGKDEFHKDEKSKKVFGAEKVADKEVNYSIIPHVNKEIIEGIVDGGKYGILREYADINNKDSKQKIGAENAVLDKFYFLLNTPLNSKFGYLLILRWSSLTRQLFNKFKLMYSYKPGLAVKVILKFSGDPFEKVSK